MTAVCDATHGEDVALMARGSARVGGRQRWVAGQGHGMVIRTEGRP
jgi:hypothetical protein